MRYRHEFASAWDNDKYRTMETDSGTMANYSDPLKLDRFWLEFSACDSLPGNGAESDESIEVFGRAEGVHHQARR